MLKIQNLSISVASKQIMKDFSYTFKKDTVYAIMGPNGSGKSSLAHVIMGSPSYEVSAEVLEFEGVDIRELHAHERAKLGIFLAFQTPLALQGIRPQQLVSLVLSDTYDALNLHKILKKIAQELHLSEELLSRSLNEGASGGERKKMEVLQAAILNRPLQIFDEIDTGADVDSLAHIATYLHEHKKGKAIIVITHYNRILKHLRPDTVLVLKDGKLVAEGDYELAERIERDGYKSL